MHLVEVDVVRLHALERGVAGPTDVQGRQLSVVRPLPHVDVELGGDDRALPPPPSLSEPASNDLLGGTPTPVGIGGVEEVDAHLVRPVHDGEGGRLVGLGTEVHGAEAEATDAETGTTEVGEVHGRQRSGTLV